MDRAGFEADIARAGYDLRQSEIAPHQVRYLAGRRAPPQANGA